MAFGIRPLCRHRQGAAALALVLEIFKKRILSVHEAGDDDRLDRWVRALGLDNVDALVAAARQPTLIVPANITFYPIHTSDNFLRKAAELFGRDLSEEAKEELLIEGNLVLKRTDMDIRFGDPSIRTSTGASSTGSYSATYSSTSTALMSCSRSSTRPAAGSNA